MLNLIDPNNRPVPYLDNSKPREERDLREVYPDLDEAKILNVFVLKNDKESLQDYEERIRQNQPIVGTLNVPRFEKLLPRASLDQQVGYNKLMSEYGFEDPHKRAIKKRKPTYIRPFQTEANETIEEIVNRKRKQVEYDMDEQDYLYLTHRNDNADNAIKVSPEVFEILITTLENEWAKLENKMNSIHTDDDTMNSSLVLDQGINNNKYGNDDGIVFGTVDDQKCAVCNESDCDNSNAIVFCDGCNIAVHQECYGVAFIPEGQWLCRKCMINPHRKFDCCFCPSKTGAFKQLDNSLWSHLICGLWINELYFANPIYMEPIEGIDLIPKSRWKLNCYICKQKVGACIQCTNRSCFQAYHVTCAKRAGLYMLMTQGIQGAVKNKLTLKSFCDKHMPSTYYLTQKQIIEGINKTRLYYRDLKLINLQNDQLTKHKQLNNKLNIFKWRTENNTPIAPKQFSNIVFLKLRELKINDLSENAPKLGLLKGLGYRPKMGKEQFVQELETISNDICKYWCLKRESKNGAPLIRKNNNLVSILSITYGNNNAQEVEDKLDFSKILLEDLNKVIQLSELNHSKQVLQQSMGLNDSSLMESVYFPISKLIDFILLDLLKVDTKRLLRMYVSRTDESISLGAIIRENQMLNITSITQLKSHLSQLQKTILSENKATNNVVKLLNKFMARFEQNFKRYLELEETLTTDFEQLPITIRGSEIDFDGDLNDSDLSDVENLDDSGELNLNTFLQ